MSLGAAQITLMPPLESTAIRGLPTLPLPEAGVREKLEPPSVDRANVMTGSGSTQTRYTLPPESTATCAQHEDVWGFGLFVRFVVKKVLPPSLELTRNTSPMGTG